MASSKTRIGIPLSGKMAFRSLHTDVFIRQLTGEGLEPVFYIDRSFLSGLPSERYGELLQGTYKRMYARPAVRLLSELRRFLVRTETTELRFREEILQKIFTRTPTALIATYMLGMDVLRRLGSIAPAFLCLEQALTRCDDHVADLRKRSISLVLTPGVGSYGFLYEGLLAREAQRLRIPVVAVISNYDNIVNRGYLGFIPDRISVWSEQMAEEACRYLRLSRARIDVTGPVQFDRYSGQPAVDRETFLRSKGLDPRKKTIFYAGSVLVPQYFEFLRIVQKNFMKGGKLEDYNVVIRPVPHNKVLAWHGMAVLKGIVENTPGMYYSDPHKFSTDSFMPVKDERCDDELDELHCLFRYSDVMINIYSTVALESAINDLPTIHLGYESFSFGQKYPSYPDFQAQMRHNRRPLRLAAARIARSDEELLRYVEMYLKDRSIDRQARQDYAFSECGVVDGRSGERLAALVARMASGGKG